MFGYSKPKKPTILVILDGLGIAPSWGGNAVSAAKTVTFDTLWKTFPRTTLLASGEAVGLPPNSPGNSEAGHLNIGAGRIIHQDISLIDQEISDGSFNSNRVIKETLDHAKKFNSSVHLIGLLSETGIHSHVRHLYALLRYFKEASFNRVFIHLISDGRDSDPMSGIELASKVEDEVKKIGVGKIVSLAGRFFAMDRDNRWERVMAAYNLYTSGEGAAFDSPGSAFSHSYSKNLTDEFLSPSVISNQYQHFCPVEDNDSVVLFNFRPDRTRELTQAFLSPSLPQMPRRKFLKNLYFATFAMYAERPLAHPIFRPEAITDTIASVWSKLRLKQFHIAETEKYPHVTYFLNGGIEKPFSGEARCMVPSPRNVKTYDQEPEMSAAAVCDATVNAIRSRSFNFIVVNFANADMVGHSGNLKATIKAVEFVDKCLKGVLDAAFSVGGNVFVCADHGNAEQMVNPRTGDPDTEHTTNPVPFIIASPDSVVSKLKLKTDGVLSSIAPTILDILSIPKPETMRNQTLVINERESQ